MGSCERMVELLPKYIGAPISGHEHALLEVVGNEIDRVERMVQVTAEQDESSKWIPVSERMPEDIYDVLIYVQFGNTPGRAIVTTYLERGGFTYGVNDPYKITHWMPLPEAPTDG